MDKSKEKPDYRKTLNLPQTDFPMKANLVQKEGEWLRWWDEQKVYQKTLSSRREAHPYILHDGPPYANGHIHIGHALNKVLKDFIVRYKTMGGRLAPFVPGWDCHGLPIEHQVLKNLGNRKTQMSQAQIRRLCREYAEEFVSVQREEFKRLGVFGDWEHPYRTMDPGYDATIVREFGMAVQSGAVYKGEKPILWCFFDEPALAEAEVEYADHTSPSIYVKFRLSGRQEDSLSEILRGFETRDDSLARRLKGKNLFVVIWTTTPWTLVANRAIALHPKLKYRVTVIGEEAYIVAQDLSERFLSQLGLPGTAGEILCVFEGARLESWNFQHPWLDRTAPVVLAEYVTLEQGTGCVHIAPGHGQEDYQVALRYGLEVFAPVDGQGRFTGAAGPFAGQRVFEANASIIDHLKKHEALLREGTLVHSYPHCWRCKNPVIFRATEQWFIALDKEIHPGESLRRRALTAIDRIASRGGWIPPWGRDRIYGMIESRPDWCISRQRVWGVPIVAFACLKCRTSLVSRSLSDYVADLMEKEGGSDLWFSRSADEILPAGTTCSTCGEIRFEKERDILDVWFESGVSHAAVLKRRPGLSWPADLYLEGSDQHRGWFHSALLTSLLSSGEPPYRAVLTHGFVVDGNGRKMSKSAGNVVAAQEVVSQYGAEILRLWVAATDFREDIRISREILLQLVEAYRKIRNTCRFLLGNLYDFTPDEPTRDETLWEIDRWALHRTQLLIRKVLQAYEAFEFHIVFHALNNFCSVDLSSFYLDILKDRLYTSSALSSDRRAAQRVLYEMLTTVTKLMAPILPFTAEEIWQKIPGQKPVSVHAADLPEEDSSALRSDLEKKWENLIGVRQEVARVLEGERKKGKIGSSLEARVILHLAPELYRFLLEGFGEEDLAIDLIVSQVALRRASPTALGAKEGALSGLVSIEVERAEGEKCERCWNYRVDVGRDPLHPGLCLRCVQVVRGAGNEA